MADVKIPQKIEITYKSIIFTLALLIALWFVIQLKEIILLVFLSLIFVSALLKPVEWLSARKVPRIIAVILVYILVISLISSVIGILVPPLVSQTSEFISRLPIIIATINDFILFHEIPVEDLSSVITAQVQSLAGNIISISTAIFSSIFVVITILVLSFYLLLEWKRFVKVATSPFSPKQERKITSTIAKVENGLGRWIRGQLTLSIVVGVLTYIGLTILQVPFALPLALIAGILEIIPIVGPIISAIPAILVALTIQPFLGLAVAALFFIIQQLENNFIVPMVMSKVVGLQPPVIIIALLIGAKLAGVGGAFLSIPILVTARIIAQELLSEDLKFEEELEEH